MTFDILITNMQRLFGAEFLLIELGPYIMHASATKIIQIGFLACIIRHALKRIQHLIHVEY
jgi:hypothetical protein